MYVPTPSACPCLTCCQVQALKAGSSVDRSEYQENRLGQDNLGFKMLQKMGWSEGAGLGSELQGITAPVGK